MVRRFIVMACAFVPALAAGASAQVTLERPAVLTSVGQSSDIAIVKVMLNTQLELGLEYKPLVLPSEVAGMKTVVIVVGASTKGLGAAGVAVACTSHFRVWNTMMTALDAPFWA